MPVEYVFIGRFTKSPTPEKSAIAWKRCLTSLGDMPIARQPRVMFLAPVRSSSSAALTPSSAACPSVYTPPPRSAGSRPATARSNVDLPEPLRPMTPIASPRFATNEMPRIACTSRIEARRCRRTSRISAVAAVPRSRPAPYTRYTTCRLSTTTIGSATAVPRLGLPENEEPGHDRHDRPAAPKPPQSGLADDGVAELAVGQVPGDVREVRVERAQVRVVGRGTWLAQSLRREDRVSDQGDVHRGRVDLKDGREARMPEEQAAVYQCERLDAEQHA